MQHETQEVNCTCNFRPTQLQWVGGALILFVVPNGCLPGAVAACRAGIGECTKNPTYMHRHCRLSCKLCSKDKVTQEAAHKPAAAAAA
jgi:hypothetical protein